MPVQCGTNMGSSSLDAVRLRQDISLDLHTLA